MSFERHPSPERIFWCVVLSAVLGSCGSTIGDAPLLQADATVNISRDGVADTGDVGISTCIADGETPNAELACCTSLVGGLIEPDGGLRFWSSDQSYTCCFFAVLQANEIAADGGTSGFPYLDPCCCAFEGWWDVPSVCQIAIRSCCPRPRVCI